MHITINLAASVTEAVKGYSIQSASEWTDSTVSYIYWEIMEVTRKLQNQKDFKSSIFWLKVCTNKTEPTRHMNSR